MGRRGSWVWRIFFGIAVVGVAAYIAFDLLDLDGSQFVSQPATAGIFADDDGADSDRALPPDTADALRLARAAPLSDGPVWTLQGRASVRCGSTSLLARRHLPRHALPDDSAASADPA